MLSLLHRHMFTHSFAITGCRGRANLPLWLFHRHENPLQSLANIRQRDKIAFLPTCGAEVGENMGIIGEGKGAMAAISKGFEGAKLRTQHLPNSALV